MIFSLLKKILILIVHLFLLVLLWNSPFVCQPLFAGLRAEQYGHWPDQRGSLRAVGGSSAAVGRLRGPGRQSVGKNAGADHGRRYPGTGNRHGFYLRKKCRLFNLNTDICLTVK